MNNHRISVKEAAAILGVSPQFIRTGLQTSRLPIGTAVKLSSIWTYHISEPMLATYSGKNIEEEIAELRERATA
jgi:hypothetical protein